MKKIGRNELCPCGSGKKYKKCHLKSNQVEVNPEAYNQELEKLKNGLYKLAFTEFRTEINESIQKYPSPSFQKENQEEAFTMGLSAWLVLNESIQDRETIADIYFRSVKDKIKDVRVRNKFESWFQVSPSAYSIEAISERYVHLRDVRTEESIKMLKRDYMDYTKGNILLGILFPFMQQEEPFVNMIEVQREKERLIKEVKNLSDIQLIAEYPTLLLNAIEAPHAKSTADSELEWEKPIYESVMKLFSEMMEEKQADPKLIQAGVKIWHEFSIDEKPSFQKAGGFAAAVEHSVYDLFAPSEQPSQRELADRYNVSANTVQRNVKKMNASYEKATKDELVLS